MMHMHGARALELTSRSVGVALDRLVGVPVDVGKSSAMAMVVDFSGRQLASPFEFTLDRAGVAEFAVRVRQALPAATTLVRVGVEACGHYHRPLVPSRVLPADWQVVEFNPAWMAPERDAVPKAPRTPPSAPAAGLNEKTSSMIVACRSAPTSVRADSAGAVNLNQVGGGSDPESVAVGPCALL